MTHEEEFEEYINLHDTRYKHVQGWALKEVYLAARQKGEEEASSQEIARLNAEIKRLREAIIELVAQGILPEYVEQGLIAVLERKCTCHMSHGECPVHGSVWEQKTST
jgi:hypothetical protein